MGSRIALNAHLKYLAVTNTAAFLLVVLLLCAASLIRVLISPLAVAALSFLTALGFGAQIMMWLHRGIHSVEADDDSLTVYRGRARVAQRLEREAIADVRIVDRLGRRSVIVRPRSGRRFRIGEDAFPREDFLRFCAFLDGWK